MFIENKNKKTKTVFKKSGNNPNHINKKEYQKPQLKNYGKLKDIVLGPSPGTGDSGLPGTEKT